MYCLHQQLPSLKISPDLHCQDKLQSFDSPNGKDPSKQHGPSADYLLLDRWHRLRTILVSIEY